MKTWMRSTLLGLGAALATAVAVAPGAARAQADDAVVGTMTQIPFDRVTPNPTGIKMYYYVPAGATAPMPIVLGLHGCQGNQNMIRDWLRDSADAHKFVLAIPFVNRVDTSAGTGTSPTGCWDVGSDDTFANATAADPAARSSSDPAAVYALIQYLGTELMCGEAPCGDLDRVFVTGQSSGAMMTNVMVGLYPELFKAAAPYMGVPYGCWASGVGGVHPVAGTQTTLGRAAGWSNACATGTVTHTGAEWAALLPPYAGTRPRMMIWFGETDGIISYVNFTEQLDQWTTALGVGPEDGISDVTRGTWKTASSSTAAHWYRVWSRTRYGEDASGQAIIEAIHVSETGHEATTFNPTIAAEAVRFFGLGDDVAPDGPADLVTGTVGAGSVALSWTAPEDDVGVVSYVIVDDEAGAIGWPTTATYTLLGLTPSTEYTLRVAAVDLAGNVSGLSNPVAFTTTADTTPPAAPTALKAVSITDTGARLTWTRATDDVGVTGYVVSRVVGDVRTEVATLTGASQALTSLSAGTEYTFEVVAQDGAGHSSVAASVTFTTTGSSGGGGGGGGGCGQGAPSGMALAIAAALLLALRRRAVRS